jgi:holo-[acyl-carrier protein] synthase
LVVGVGLDLVAVRKMDSSLRRDGFKRQAFTPAEIAHCDGRKNAAECYAGRFAAKEAFVKAIGRGLGEGIWFSQIEVLGKPGGQPSITVQGEAERALQSLGATVTVHLSITHTAGFAAAVVVLETGTV